MRMEWFIHLRNTTTGGNCQLEFHCLKYRLIYATMNELVSSAVTAMMLNICNFFGNVPLYVSLD